MAEVQNEGRLYYIEPNNFISDLKVNGAIPQPYENYCISVDLEVQIRNRLACGDSTQNKVYHYSSSNGSISFMGGVDGFLTTKYTDVSSSSLVDDMNECIGIENIHVSYQSWLYPQVSIKFVDVRGGALMNPAELSYDDNGKIKNATLFNTFFAIPYPLFKLRIKGFYGKGVTYNLAVSKVNIELDSESGSFVANVDFIGYMYGLYGDLPMSLCVAAPYMKYSGKRYWDSQLMSRFRYDEYGIPQGAPIYRYNDLRAAIKRFNENSEPFMGGSINAQKIINIEKQIEAAKDIRDFYNRILSVFKFTGYLNQETIKQTQNWDTSRNFLGKILALYKNGDGAELANVKQNANGSYYSEHSSYALTKDNVGIGSEQEFFSKIDSYNQTYNTHKITSNVQWLKDLVNDGRRIYNSAIIVSEAVGRSYRQVIKWYGVSENGSGSDAYGNTEFYNKYGRGSSTLSEVFEPYSDTFPKLLELCQRSTVSRDREVYCLFVLDDGLFEREINKIIEELEAESKALENERVLVRNQDLKLSLGFAPTIGNAYKTAFAHMETFVQAFFDCLDRIQEDISSGKRNKELINGKTDIDDYINVIPPFPLIMKEDIDGTSGVRKNIMVTPEEGGFMDSEEMKFVDSLLEAAKQFGEEMQIDEISGSTTDRKGIIQWYPLTTYDIFNYGKAENPYNYLLRGGIQSDYISEYIMTTFAQRFFDFYSSLNGMSLDVKAKLAQVFAKVEAYNLFNAVCDFNERRGKVQMSFVNSTKYSQSVIGDEFVRYMTSDDEGKDRVIHIPNGCCEGEKHRFAYYKNNNLQYNWFHQNSDGIEDSYIPVGIYNQNEIQSSYLTQSGPIADKSNWICFRDELNTNTDKVTINGNIELIKSASDSSKTILSGDGLSDAYNEYLLSKKYRSISSPWDGNRTNLFGTLPSKGNITFSNIFTHPAYYAQNGTDEQLNRLSRAYMVLLSMQFSNSYNENEYKKTFSLNNGVYRKLDLLTAGALLWREEYMGSIGSDPIITDWSGTINSNGTKSHYSGSAIKASSTEMYMHTTAPTLGDSNAMVNICADFSNTDPKVKYMGSWVTSENVPERKKNYLIEYFKEWAFGDFIKLSKAFELHYGSSFSAQGKSVESLVSPALMCLVNEQKNISDMPKENVCTFINQTPWPIKEVYENITSCGKNCSIATPNKQYFLTVSDKDYVDDLFVTELYFCDEYSNVNGQSRYIGIPDSTFKSVIQVFKKEVDSIFGQEEGSFEADTIPTVQNTENNMRLATYMTLKGLYDKWLCGADRFRWMIVNDDNGSASEFSHFKYIDAFNNNFKDALYINPEQLVLRVEELVRSFRNQPLNSSSFLQVGGSIYEYFNSIAQDNGLLFMALPQLKSDTTEKDLRDMFTAFDFPHYAPSIEDETTSYICLYTGSKSDHLKNGNGFKDDGIVVADNNGNLNSPDRLLPEFTDNEGSGDIAAFGVTYAKQNQSFFKNISIGMNNPIQTEASIAATMEIASRGSTGPKETSLYGQDIYRTYAGYSYNCDVTMMGDAQIMPLMNFQLNNVPMFRGLYQIMSVEHSITAGNMETTFKGYRISRNNIPLITFDPMFVDLRKVYNMDNVDFSSNINRSEEELNLIRNDKMVEDKFAYKNLVASSTAKSLGIDNTPTDIHNQHLTDSVKNLWSIVYYDWMEYIEGVNPGQKMDYDWIITSCYRSKELNDKISNNSGSTHTLGYAIDFQIGKNGVGDPSKLVLFQTWLTEYLRQTGICFDQFIRESDSKGSRWTHLGYKNSSGKSRREIFDMYVTVENGKSSSHTANRLVLGSC